MKPAQPTEGPSTLSEDCEIELSLFSREHKYEETDITRTFGITAVFTGSDGKRHEKIITDISSDKKNVERIKDILTENKISYFHIEAVIEDIILEDKIV